MKIIRLVIFLLCSGAALLFYGCEKESVNSCPLNTDYLLSRIYRGDKLYQEFIYENKKLVRVNYYSDDTVSFYETYEYNIAGRAVKKEDSYGSYETYEYSDSGRYEKMNIYYEEDILYKSVEFIYNDQGFIGQGIAGIGDNEKWYISYTYDSKGNVLTRTEDMSGGSQFPLSYSEYEYDDKNNPRFNWGLPTDVVQHNNPLKYFNENMISCSLPPNFEYEYEYNQEGYPLIEIRKEINTEYTDTFYYEYVQ